MRREQPPSPDVSRRPSHAIGLFGGTFDPIHLGHLRLAEELAETLDLAEVRFMPTGTPPHRTPPRASAADRHAMVAAAIAGNPRFVLDEREIWKTTPCYMVDSLTGLRAELGNATPILLFLGTDAFAGLSEWQHWTRLFELTHIVVAHRPGFSAQNWAAHLPEALRGELASRRCEVPGTLLQSPAGRIAWHPLTQLDISATAIRALCTAGQSPRYLVPDAVLAYIRQHRLYH